MSDRIKKLGRELADQHMKGYAVGRREALADAKARIEDLHYGDDNLLIGTGYQLAVNDALAALTQPQTEQWHENDEADKAATAAGVADADLEAAAMEISVKATRLDPETYKVPDKLIWMLRSALFPNEDMERIKSPGPYAKAFRERVCPVPEFPSIRETAHEAIIEGGCCIQCGLPNNSETVLFHSCQAGAPADPTCPNTGHKFSHCDCDLGIEKEES